MSKIAEYIRSSRGGPRAYVILGIGVDLCQVERIRRSLDRFGDAWINRVFTSDERYLCDKAYDPVLLFARGFCGKEACAKALGTGVGSMIGWRDIEVLQSKLDTTMRLCGGALSRLHDLTPVGFEAKVHISCSGDRRLMQAIVTASAAQTSAYASEKTDAPLRPDAYKIG